jgi:hypothetical protein
MLFGGVGVFIDVVKTIIGIPQQAYAKTGSSAHHTYFKLVII